MSIVSSTHLFAIQYLEECSCACIAFRKGRKHLLRHSLTKFLKRSVCPRERVRISTYTNQQSRLSHHSVRSRENGAEVYPKQSSLERCL